MNKPICILLCILLISLSIVPVFADTINEVTPDTYATIFDTLLQQQSTGTCSNVDTLPQFILDCMPSGYDWNMVSWFDSGNGYYDIGFAVVPDGYYPIQLNAGAIYQTVSMPGLQNTCCFGFYTKSTGDITGFEIQNDSNSFIMIYYHNKDNYVHFFKDTQFNMAGQSYKVVVPVVDPVNPSNPNYPSGNPYDPTVPSDWVNYSEMIAGLLYDNFKFTCNNTTYNSTWMPVGEYLMYDFLCKNNPQNDTVSFNNWEYQNYVYRICGLNHEDDVITIMELLDDINYYHGNYLSSISNSLNYDPEYDLGFAYNVITPLNKIAQVYASDQEIEAREAAADNQQAIVDEFIDPDSDGAVDPDSFSDLSALSSGYKTNMSTDASPSSIWDIFNSNHFGWFSQETANQLDTSSNNRKGSSFDTPLLDQQLEEIYNSLGVNNND